MSRVESNCRESRVKVESKKSGVESTKVESRVKRSRVERKMSRVDKWHQQQQSKYIFNKIYTTTKIISLPVLYRVYQKKVDNFETALNLAKRLQV